MTENPDTQPAAKSAHQDATGSIDKRGVSPPKTAAKTGRSNAWLLALIIMLVVAVAAASGYAHWWQFQQAAMRQVAAEQQTQALQEQLAQQGALLEQAQEAQRRLRGELTEQIQTSDRRQQQQQNAQETLAQQVEAQQQRLLQLSSANSQNWELAEALYLTRLANQRLVMEQNRHAALALLEGAEEIIGRQQNPELFSVRATLNDDIAALKTVEPVDKEGLFLRLSALHEQVQQLSLTKPLDFQARRDEFPMPLPEEDQGFWRRIAASFQQAFGQLDGYIRKVELQAPVKPLLAPEEQQSIFLGLSLYIESAQIALLRDQPLIFKNALHQARQQLTTYYPDNSRRQELVLSLQSLESELEERTLPDISASYLALNDYLRSRAQQAGQNAFSTDSSPPSVVPGEPAQ